MRLKNFPNLSQLTPIFVIFGTQCPENHRL